MRKYIIISLSILAVGFSACNKSFLEKYPVGQISKDQLLQDVEGLVTALNGSYNLVAKYHMSEFGMLGDLRGDDVILMPGNDTQMLQEYNYQPESDDALTSTYYIWQKLYEALNNTNNVINSVSKVLDLYPEEKKSVDSIQGQALVLRSLIHFNLAQAFAQPYNFSADGFHLGMPILKETPHPSSLVSRDNMHNLYAFIISDLEHAIELMANNNNTNQVTASAQGAQAFLSRIYLYMEKWEESIHYADLVVQSGRFALESQALYENMYMDPGQVTGRRSVEVIWQLNLNPSIGLLNSYFSNPDSYKVTPSAKWLDLFEEGDVRQTLLKEGSIEGQPYTTKYALMSGIPPVNWPANFKVFRLAEVYLNRAEALWHLGDYANAVKDLTKIKARAFGVPESEMEITYTTADDLLEQIKVERRKELAFEGHRIYDILRYKEDLIRGSDCNSALCTLTYPNNRFILPIPQLEIDANPLMQPNP